MKHVAIAIDGPAGAGKSTIARRVAAELGFTYVDTGSMYRAIAWKTLEQEIDPSDEEKVVQLAQSLRLSLNSTGVSMDGVGLSEEIRTPQVSTLASAVAKIEGVRQVLVQKQQEIARRQSVVMDGRDIGTHVLPQAQVKIFLTASIEERANRRLKELQAKGITMDFAQLAEEIRERDENDRNRLISPLRQAEDAILVDTTQYSIDEVVQVILQLCRNQMGEEE